MGPFLSIYFIHVAYEQHEHPLIDISKFSML